SRPAARLLLARPPCSGQGPPQAPHRPPELQSADPRPRSQTAYPSPSVGSDPKCRSNSSELIGEVPVRLRISSMEVALEGQSGAKMSFTCAASSSVIESICSYSSALVIDPNRSGRPDGAFKLDLCGGEDCPRAQAADLLL